MSGETAGKFVAAVNFAAARVGSGLLGLTYVVEYPKCGGSWIARLVRSYVGVDARYGRTAVIRRGAVLQRHTLYRSYIRKPVVVVRDPRDVLVSFFFHETWQNPNRKLLVRIGYDPDGDVRENMFRYIRDKLDRPYASNPFFTYEEFVDSWRGVPHARMVRYEEFYRDTQQAFTDLVKRLGLRAEEDRIRASVEENTFFALTGRQRGETEVTHHKRKGIVGDWRNWFSDEMHEFVLSRQRRLMDKLEYTV
jgi:hypothetical protein